MTAKIDWGDGTTSEADVNDANGSFAGKHEYDSGGIFVVTTKLSDGSGSATATTRSVVSGVGLRDDGTLQIVGTNRNDYINVKRQGSKIVVRYRLHGHRWQTEKFKLSEVKAIQVYACSGSDVVKIHPWINVPTSIDAGAGNDIIHGGGGDTKVDGGSGNDLILTRQGDDVVVDMSGRNVIDTGSGDDEVSTGAGLDIIRTSHGNDVINDLGGLNFIYSGNGNDVINTGDGFDFIIASNGNDTINSGGGRDVIYGGSGHDVINAGADADAVFGGSGHDLIRGGDGNDLLNGSSGHDILLGEGGRDRLVGSSGRDILIGGLGRDILRGGSQDDVLIAGTTDYDANDQSLKAILNEWKSNASYNNRVGTLINGGGGLAGPLDASTVQDDRERDWETGQSGRDLFYARIAASGVSRSLLDVVTDKRSNEELIEI